MSDAREPPSLDEVVITDALDRRPSRAPDHAAESRALRALVEAMATEPGRILQRLAEVAMELTRSDSAGISFLEPLPGGEAFRWVATAGAYIPYLNGVMPRTESPCGEVIARSQTLLFASPERVYPAFRSAQPYILEGLLAPFLVEGRPAGTVWVVKHSPGAYFEREDARLLESLGGFAAAAHGMTAALEAVRAGKAELEERVEERTRALRESEGRQAFLLGLSDVLRAPGAPDDIAEVAARHLGERLGADRVCYGEITGDRLVVARDHARGVPSIVGEHRLAHLGQGFLAGYRPSTLVTVRDVASDDRLSGLAREGLLAQGIAAFADVVLSGDDRGMSILAVQQATPRAWTAGEEILIREVADRVRMAIERARVERELREAERLAAAAEALRQAQKMEAMGQLTGGVAHDFNNLLTPIVGALDMLRRKGIGGEREARWIEGAAQAAERARVLVQRLLAFARRQPLQATAVDLAALVRGMSDLVASTTGPQIRVSVEVADDLPAAWADPNQIEMALLNLAVNARDAMPDGGTLRISAGVEAATPRHRSGLPDGDYLLLSVADTGTGMDEAVLARAVEPFFSTKGVGKGTGLGLSMVHGLASQLGGALTIQSRRGVGTNVELWLPLSRDDAVHDAVAEEGRAAPTGSGTVLLVDDEGLVRTSTAEMLTDLGYAVVAVASAEDALRELRGGLVPSIVVTDHLMPGMNGTDLARVVRAEQPGMRVLLMSGYADVDGIAPDLPRLVKPFRSDELAAGLAALEVS